MVHEGTQRSIARILDLKDRIKQLINTSEPIKKGLENYLYTQESVLNTSILLFTDLLNYEIDQLWTDTNNLDLDSIGFSNDCWERLNDSFIFREDHFEFVLSISVNAFINIFNSDLLFNAAINCILEKISSLVNRSIKLDSKNKSYGEKIIQDFDFIKIINLPINFTKITIELSKYIIIKNINCWQKLIPLTVESIIENKGIYYSTFKLIQSFYYLNDYLSSINNRLKYIYLNVDKWKSFQTMVYAWLSEVPKLNDRNIEIIINRLGIKNEDHKTLQQLGEIYNLTRERIRQIIEKAEYKILKHTTAISKSLKYIINYLIQSYGILTIQKLAEKLSNVFNWKDQINLKGLEYCIKYLLRNSRIEILYDLSDICYLRERNFCCITCKEMQEYFARLITVSDTIKIDTLVSRMKYYCFLKIRCNNRYIFTSSFAIYMLKSNTIPSDKAIIVDDLVYSIDSYNLKWGKISQVIELILKKSNISRHFSDITKTILKSRPDLNANERIVHSTLCRLDNVILWDRGSFIHKNCINFNYSLIRKVEDWLYRKLEHDIPFISIDGAYKQFQNECVVCNLPSSIALYSCLRLSNNPLLYTRA